MRGAPRLSVAPDLIWGPCPTPFAAPRGRSGSPTHVCRASRYAVPLTTAAWAPNQVWGDGSREQRVEDARRDTRGKRGYDGGGGGYDGSRGAPHLFVAPDLIWGPYPTLFAALMVRSGPPDGVCWASRYAVPPTTAAWAPNQVWGDGSRERRVENARRDTRGKRGYDGGEGGNDGKGMAAPAPPSPQT